MEKLSDGERRFRLIADNAPVLMWRADETMARDWVNRAWLDFTGRTLERELGFGWTEAVHPDDRESCLASYKQAFARGEPVAMTYRLRRADGAYRWMMDKGQPVAGAKGGVEGYFGSCTDVDDIVKANEALAEAVREREEAVAQRDHLLHEVQHRVRNNLQLILSIIDMQARSENVDSRRALAIVAGRVRSIAKAQSLLLDPTGRAQIDLGEYVASLAQGAAGRAQPVSVDKPPGPLNVPLSRAVPLGLMINEILSARLDADADQPARITLREGDGEVRLELEAQGALAGVRDTAPAGPSKLVERLGAQAGAQVEIDENEPARVVLRIRNDA